MIRELIGLADARRRIRQLEFALRVADTRAERLVDEAHRAALDHEAALGKLERALDDAEKNAREQHGRAVAMIESAERSEAVLDSVLDALSQAFNIDRDLSPREIAARAIEEADRADRAVGDLRDEIAEACEMIGAGGDGTLKGRVETLLAERHNLHQAVQDVARIIGEPGHTEDTIVEAVRNRVRNRLSWCGDKAKPALKLTAPVCQAEGCVRAAPHTMRVGIADALNDLASAPLFFGDVHLCHAHKDELLGQTIGTSERAALDAMRSRDDGEDE